MSHILSRDGNCMSNGLIFSCLEDYFNIRGDYLFITSTVLLQFDYCMLTVADLNFPHNCHEHNYLTLCNFMHD